MSNAQQQPAPLESGVPGPWRRWRWLVFTILTLAALGIGIVLFLRATPAERADQQLRLAASLVQRGELDAARQLLDRAEEVLPDSARVHYLRGRILIATGEHEAAVSCFQRALELQPTHAESAIVLASWHLDQEDTATALSFAERAVSAAPGSAEAHRVRAGILQRMGRLGPALEDWRAAVRITPSDALSAFRGAFLADVIGRDGWSRADTAVALALFDRVAVAVSGFPAGDEKAVRSAELDAARGVRGPALAALADLRPENAGLRVRAAAVRAYCLEAEGRAREGADVLAAADAETPAPELAAEIVRLWTRAGRLRAARAALRDAEARFPGHAAVEIARAALERASVLAARPDDLLAAGLSRRAVAYNPLEAEIGRALAGELDDPVALRVRLGRRGPALLAADEPQALSVLRSDIETLLATNQVDPVALTWSAAVALREGDTDAAQASLDAAVAADPALPETWHVRALVGLAAGSPAAAATNAEQAVTLDGSPAQRACWVRSLGAAGHIQRALKAGRAALTNAPGDLHVSAALLALPEGALQADERTLLEARIAAAAGDPSLIVRLAERGLAGDVAALGAERALADAWLIAAEVFEQRRAADPADAGSLFAQLACLERAGLAEVALRTGREALEEPAMAKHREAIQLALAALLSRRGDGPEAIALLESIQDRTSLVRRQLAATFAAHGEPVRAAEQYGEIARQEGDSAEAAAAALSLLGLRPLPPQAADTARAWVEQSSQDTTDRRLVEGFLALLDGRAADAVSIGERCLTDAPDDARAVALLANGLLGAGDPKAAERTIRSATERGIRGELLVTVLSEARLALGLRANADGDVDEALRQFEGALVGGPNDAAAATWIARRLIATGERTRAHEIAARTEQRVPRGVAAPLLRGLVDAQLVGSVEALAHFREAHDRAPGNAAAITGLARTAIAAGVPDLALESCAEWASRSDAPVMAKVLYARLQEELGRADEARAAYAAILDEDPANLAALRRLVMLLVGAGDSEGARKRLAAFAAHEPARADSGTDSGNATPPDDPLEPDAGPAAALAELAWLQFHAGDPTAACETYQRAIAARPAATGSYFQLLDALEAAGRFDAADGIAQELEREHPTRPEPPTMRGILADRGGASDDAVAHYRRALEIDPEFALALNNIAWTLGVTLRRPEEGLPFAERAAARLPRDPDIAHTLGWLLHGLDRDSEALPRLTLAVEHRPEVAQLWLDRAQVFQALGRLEEAAADLRHLLAQHSAFAEANHVRQRIDRLER